MCIPPPKLRSFTSSCPVRCSAPDHLVSLLTSTIRTWYVLCCNVTVPQCSHHYCNYRKRMSSWMQCIMAQSVLLRLIKGLTTACQLLLLVAMVTFHDCVSAVCRFFMYVFMIMGLSLLVFVIHYVQRVSITNVTVPHNYSNRTFTNL